MLTRYARFMGFLTPEGMFIINGDEKMSAEIKWNNCKDSLEPEWKAFDAFELAGCIEQDGGVERVERGEKATFYTLYGHCTEGGCEALHDFPDGFNDLEKIRAACSEKANSLSFDLWDYT